MTDNDGPDETLADLWRFEGLHPEWTQEEGGPDGWAPEVSWWAIRTPDGLVVVDPIVHRWQELDVLVESAGGLAAILRTCHWHQRSITEVAARYDAPIWAKAPPSDAPPLPLDHHIAAGQALPGGLGAFEVVRHDEVALWLPEQAALMFGDAMLRTEDGRLRVCPDSWVPAENGPALLRTALRAMLDLRVRHVLVSHGPLVLGDGHASLQHALEPQA